MKAPSILLSTFVLSVSCLSAQAQPAAPAAPSSAPVRIDIGGKALVDALNELAHQAGLQLLLDADVSAQSARAPRISGSFTPEDALRKLLANSNLQYEFLDARTVAVRTSKPARAGAPGASTETAQPALKLATAEEPQRDGGAGRTNEAEGADSDRERGIPEILVQGRRSSNADIRRSEDDVQPYVVFGAEEIERSNADNLEQFLKTRLPMNNASYSYSQISSEVLATTRGNQSSVDLRGLGPNQTLILVNGRRLPGVFQGIDASQPDINGIPLSSVERIEILPSTAGGIYGGGATGGVINIVLKSDYSGMELRARYDNTFDSDAGQRRVEGNAGFSLEGGRTQVVVAGSYSDSNHLEVGDRDFLVRGRALLAANNPAGFGQMPAGATANILSADGQPLRLKSTGQSLGYTFAYVPYGYAGPATDNGLAFLGTAGRYNYDLPQGAGGSEASLLVAPKVSSGSLNVRREFPGRVELFLDSALNRNEGFSRNGGNFPRQVLLLPSTAPNNPFQQAIQVRFTGSDFDAGTTVPTSSETLTATGGMKFGLPGDWTAQAEYGWSRSRSDYQNSPNVLTAAGLAALQDGRLDILRDVEARPLDYSPYLFSPLPSYSFVEPGELLLRTTSLRLAGPVAKLPAGPVMLSTLLERRSENPQRRVIEQYSLPNVPSYSYGAPAQQKTRSAYVELTAPLLGAVQGLPWVKALDVQASYRRDNSRIQALIDSTRASIPIPSPEGPFPDVDYTSNRIEASQYTLGLRYQPVEALALRTSFGFGILPPSLGQLVPTGIDNFPLFIFGLRDPKRGNTSPFLARMLTSGNAALRPEESRSVSAGFIFTPASLPDLRFSVDYTRIRKSDEIVTPDMQVLLDLEDVLPGRVTRAALTGPDSALGYTGGQITTLDAGFLNFASSLIEAFDVQLDYRWATAFGTFRPTLIASYQTHFKRQVLPGAPLVDNVGHATGPLRVRGNAGLTWDRNAWTAGWNMQYYDSYLIYPAASAAFADFYAASQGSMRIRNQTYHDLFVKYRFEAGVLANSEIMLGINNVLASEPPILATSGYEGGGYSNYGDPRLRRYSISLRKSFQ